MIPEEALAEFRTFVRDEVEPYLWSDGEIYKFLDRAQKDIARYSGGIGDSRSNLTYLQPVAGVADYPLSPRILKIRDVYRASDGKKLPLYNEENISADGFYPATQTGRPSVAVVGMDGGYLTLSPTPDETSCGDMLRLVLYRLPLKDIDAASTAFEIPEHQQPALIIGAAAQAYRKQDAETFDRERAVQFEQEFRALCDQIKRERERREHRPRRMSYGGL